MEGEGIHVLQNCKTRRQNVSDIFATSPPGLKLYFSGTDDKLYEDSESNTVNPRNAFTADGIDFINGQNSFKSLTDDDPKDALAHSVSFKFRVMS